MIDMKFPRIAFIDLAFNWPPVGGCWVDLKEIMSRLMARGFEVCLFTPVWTDYYPRGDIREELPFPVHRIHFSRFTFNAWHLRQRFGKAVREWSPDLVFLGEGYHLKHHLLAHFAPDFPVYVRFYAYDTQCLNLHYWLYDQHRVCDGGFLTDPARCHRCWHPGASFPKRLAKILLGYPDRHPQLHFTQEYAAALAFTPWYRFMLPEWLWQAEALIVYNEFTAQFYRKHSNRVRIIPSGVDTSRFPCVTPTDRRKKIILVPGRINDELKGFSTVRQACQRLYQMGYDFEVRITTTCEIPTHDPWIHNLGWVSQDRVPSLYQEADIVIVPSIWVEPFGITTLEAMSSGLPVVGSRIGGIAETIVHGQSGLHFEPGNSEQLCALLRGLLESSDLRRRLGEAARQRAVEQYDWDQVVDRHYVQPFLLKFGQLQHEKRKRAWA